MLFKHCYSGISGLLNVGVLSRESELVYDSVVCRSPALWAIIVYMLAFRLVIPRLDRGIQGLEVESRESLI